MTAFLSAALLFTVQPMFARMVLPLLGGSPAVWNTAMVFYQAVLLLGYGYSHFATRWLGVRQQKWLHLVVMLVPLLVLPITVRTGWSPPTGDDPLPWLLALLAVAVGLPFFVVSTSAPLLQKWFAASHHRAAHDPYFLYAASNLGSMVGLLGYPFVVEPHLRLATQSQIWSAGYVALIALTAVCAVALARNAPLQAHEPIPSAAPRPERRKRPREEPPVTWPRRAHWIALAFVPSSLTLGVTQHISTDIAAIPLLWVVPLAIYLLSFIVVFARRQLVGRTVLIRTFPFAVLPVVVALSVDLRNPLWLALPIHLVALLSAALVCHGTLARDRPATQHLTEFYLWLAVGGVAGGIFNALLAPRLFPSVMEYPLVLALACFMVPVLKPGPNAPRARLLDLLLPAVLAALALLLTVALKANVRYATSAQLALIAIPLTIATLSFVGRPLRFALAVLALMFVNFNQLELGSRILVAQRSFFGVHKVVCDTTTAWHILYHGPTAHGVQSVVTGRRDDPLSYYGKSGPAGQMFESLPSSTMPRRVAVVGLGAGTLAAYGKTGEQWTFYEIDPEVVRIALHPPNFTYLVDSRARLRVVLGDARQSLAADDTSRYDLMILDAYTSDAIPTHLITREALRLYMARLTPRGVLAFHLSSRFFNLAPVVAKLAEDAGLVCLIRDDVRVSRQEQRRGVAATTYAVVARAERDLGSLAADARWQRMTPAPGMATWTDDYSSLISVIDWRR